MLSPRQAGLRSSWSTLDQILCLFLFVSDAYNKLKPGSRTIPAPIDFPETIGSIWHSSLFHNLNLGSVSLWIFRWTQFILSKRRACAVIKIKQVAPFESAETSVLFHKALLLALHFSLFSLTISLRLYLLPSNVLFILTTWPSGSTPPRYLLLQMPQNELFSTPFLFLHISVRKASSSLVTRRYVVSLGFYGAFSTSPLVSSTKLFISPFSLMLHPDGLHFSTSPTYHVKTPSPRIQSRHHGCFSCSHRFYSLIGVLTFSASHSDSFALSSYEWALVFQTPF